MFRAFRILFLNELASMLRAPPNIFFIFLFPLFFLGIMLYSYGTEGTLGPVTVEVVDEDRSGMSQEYLDRVKKLFTSSGVISGEVLPSDGRQPLAAGRIRLTLSQGFEQAVVGSAQNPAPTQTQTQVRLEYNASNSMVTQIATRVFEPLTLRFNADMTAGPAPVSLSYRNATAQSSISFPQYLVTGIVVMSMMSTAIISTALIVAFRREQNTFKLMACLPLGAGSVLAAILAARALVIVFAALLLLAVAVYGFGLPVPLDVPRVAHATVLIALGGVALLSLGLVVAARLSTVQGAIFIGNLIYIALLLLSDLAVPLRSLAAGPREFLSYLPTSSFVAGLRGILVHGESVLQQTGPIAVLVSWTVVFLVIARVSFRWHRS